MYRQAIERKMEEKKLFLLDAMALIYRAYFALNKNPRITSKGVNTSAFLGFANALLDLLKKEKPTHLGVAFDTMAPTARHLEFTDYKANREKMPEDISVAIPYIKRLLQALNIPILYAEGYEADDVIGTLSKKAEKEGFKVYMVTPDKDFGQLVDENVLIYKPSRSGNGVEIMGVAEVCAKFGIEHPRQVIDMLGLWGDASDNIPGVPGVGEVTARKLLARFGSMENLLEHVDEVENEKLREKIRQNAAQARESKMLATIILDAPVPFDEDGLRLSAPDIKAVSELLDELEMRSFSSRLLAYYKLEAPVGQQTVTETVTKTGRKRTEVQDTTLDMFSEEAMIEEKPYICPDLNGVEYWKDEAGLKAGLESLSKMLEEGADEGGEPRMVAGFYLMPVSAASIRHSAIACMAFCVLENAAEPVAGENSETAGMGEKVVSAAKVRLWAYYIPSCFAGTRPETASDARLDEAGRFSLTSDEKEVLAAFLSRHAGSRNWVCHDLKNQLHLLANQGIELELQAFDIMLAHYLMDPEGSHDLMRMTRNYLPFSYQDAPEPELLSALTASSAGLLETEALWADPENPLRSEAVRYSLQNAKVACLLQECFKPELERVEAGGLFWNVEIPLSRVLCRMERVGVKIDTGRLKQYGDALQAQISQVENEIYGLAGEKFNIASPKQLGEVLFEKLQITDKPKHTRTKQFSTAEDVLQKLTHKHPIVEKVLFYRSLTKLKSTYVDALPLLIDPWTGKIHTTYNQAVTATGRLSSQNPNLQNIPVRTDLGREIRKCFVPEQEGESLLSADYSQIELRIIAHLSGDRTMLQDFGKHKDVHTATAANVFGVKPEEVTPAMRRQAKTVNFGIIYGISAFGLAERLQIPRKEAADLIERYYRNYGQLKAYMEKVVADAKEKGYVETLLHRRRYLKDINSGNAVVRAYAERNAVNAPVQGSSADMIKLAMIAIDRRIRQEKMASRMILQVHDELVFNVPGSEVERLAALVEKEMKEALPMRVPVEVEVCAASNWLDAH